MDFVNSVKHHHTLMSTFQLFWVLPQDQCVEQNIKKAKTIWKSALMPNMVQNDPSKKIHETIDTEKHHTGTEMVLS